MRIRGHMADDRIGKRHVEDGRIYRYFYPISLLTAFFPKDDTFIVFRISFDLRAFYGIFRKRPFSEPLVSA